MTFTKSQKRSRKKAETENFYKILNTRSNATPETIKKKYIESIRQYPPETHPEQFQQIRRAYETLRDPQKRREYDLHRKYGGDLETLLDKAYALSEESEWEEAGRMFNRILELQPTSVAGLLGMAHVAMHTETGLSDDEYFDQAYRNVKIKEEKIGIRTYQARLLYQHNRSAQAFDILNQLKDKDFNAIHQNFDLYIRICTELDRNDEAWRFIVNHVKQLEQQQEIVEINVYMEWLHLIIKMEKWEMLGQVQKRVSKLLKSIVEEDERQSILLELMEEYDGFYEAGRFREALIFIELVYVLTPQDKELREELQEARQNAMLEKEINRMMKDDQMFPFVTMHAIEWFYTGILDDEFLYSFRESIPDHMKQQMEEDNEGIAYGINRLRKKYTAMYRNFKDQWEEMYRQKTASMNREQRRSIR